MPKTKSRKQKRRQKVEAKRRRLQQRNNTAGIVERASRHAIRECWISSTWRDPQQLTQIAVARPMNDRGTVAYMAVLVDRMCLGAKTGYLRTGSAVDFELHLDHMREPCPMQRCDPALAAKIVQVGLDYAHALGFAPVSEAAEAIALLDDVDPEDCDEPIKVGGPEGKPFYVAGPHDDVVRIITRLRNRLGPDGFNYLVPGEWMNDRRVRHLLEGGNIVELAETDA